MSEQPSTPAWLLVVLGVCLVLAVAGYGYAHRNDPAAIPCASMKDLPRDRVPARCFADFNPDSGKP